MQTKRKTTRRKRSITPKNIVSESNVQNIENKNDELAVQPSENKEETVKQNTVRPKRIPLGTRDVLKYPDRKGYIRRVFNDDPNRPGNRIQSAKEAGWAVVEGEDGTLGVDGKAGKASRIGSATAIPVGGGIKGVLMEIPEEWYNEDQAAKLVRNKQTEDGLRRSKVTAREAGEDGTYGEVKIN